MHGDVIHAQHLAQVGVVTIEVLHGEQSHDDAADPLDRISLLPVRTRQEECNRGAPRQIHHLIDGGAIKNPLAKHLLVVIGRQAELPERLARDREGRLKVDQHAQKTIVH